MENTPLTHTPGARAQEPNALLQDAGVAASSQTSIKPSNSAKEGDKPFIAGAQLHAIGSIADISANWSAKVVVASEEQTDRTKMAAVYESMAATFVRDGLNLAAIVAIRQFYGGVDADPEPLYYEHFPTPLQQGAVRLVVFKPKPNTLDPVHQDPLLHLTHEACQDILASAPSGMQPHASLPENYHLTVFMTSQPGDPRADPFTPGGGIDPIHPPVPIPAPTSAVLQQEIDVCRQIALTAAPAFEVHSVVFANSGTLLLCLVDTTGQLAGLRQKVREAFPGASSKQSSIMHMTLGRVLKARQLTDAEREAMQQRCSLWSSRLKGTVFKPEVLWHVQEHQFTTVAGVCEPLPLSQP